MTSIAEYAFKVRRLEAKIEKLESRPQKIARVARIERYEARLDKLLNNAPEDEFSISLSQPFPEAQPDFWRYTVEITDSPYDDSFTGGDPFYFQIQWARQSQAPGAEVRALINARLLPMAITGKAMKARP